MSFALRHFVLRLFASPLKISLTVLYKPTMTIFKICKSENISACLSFAIIVMFYSPKRTNLLKWVTTIWDLESLGLLEQENYLKVSVTLFIWKNIEDMKWNCHSRNITHCYMIIFSSVKNGCKHYTHPWKMIKTYLKSITMFLLNKRNCKLLSQRLKLLY